MRREGMADLVHLLEHRTVPALVAGTRDELGAAVGGPPLSALAVTRREFADPLLRQLRSETDGGNEGRDSDARGGR